MFFFTSVLRLFVYQQKPVNTNFLLYVLYSTVCYIVHTQKFNSKFFLPWRPSLSVYIRSEYIYGNIESKQFLFVSKTKLNLRWEFIAPYTGIHIKITGSGIENFCEKVWYIPNLWALNNFASGH